MLKKIYFGIQTVTHLKLKDTPVIFPFWIWLYPVRWIHSFLISQVNSNAELLLCLKSIPGYFSSYFTPVQFNLALQWCLSSHWILWFLILLWPSHKFLFKKKQTPTSSSMKPNLGTWNLFHNWRVAVLTHSCRHSLDFVSFTTVYQKILYRRFTPR